MIEAAQMTTTQSVAVMQEAKGTLFPNVQLLVNDWIQQQISALPSLELSYGILAKPESQIPPGSAVAKSPSQGEIGFASLSASLYGQSSDIVTDWVELWDLLGADLCKKVGEYLAAQWDNTADPDLALCKESLSRSFYFSLSALPVSAQLFMQLDVLVKPQNLAKQNFDKSTRQLKCAAYLDLGVITLGQDELKQVEVGGVFVFGLKKRAQLALPIVFGRLGDCRLPANWTIETGEITMLNIEQLAALESEAQQSQLEPPYLSLTELKIPIQAVVELDGISIDTLQTIKPQQILASNVKVDDCIVKLSANGQAFAQGQLLEMNGQLCVRLTKVY